MGCEVCGKCQFFGGYEDHTGDGCSGIKEGRNPFGDSSHDGEVQGKRIRQ